MEENPFLCNRCLQSIADFRYKCLSCVDFDLCGACMGESHEGHSSEAHVLVKLSVTLSQGQDQVFDAPDDDPVSELQNSLLILDGVHHLGLDIPALAAHTRLPPNKVRAALDRYASRSHN